MKSDKHMYTLLQRRNTTNDDQIKEFEAYIKVIELYRGKKPIHPGLVKANITKMEILDTNNKPP